MTRPRVLLLLALFILATLYVAWFGAEAGSRQASYYDPKTQKFQLIETCYSTHHLQFDNDPNETVYFNELSGEIVGWVDSKVYDDTLAATKTPSPKTPSAAATRTRPIAAAE